MAKRPNKSVKQARFSQSAFLLNAKDFDLDVGEFTNQELGIYLRLLLYQWVNKSLPDDVSRLFVIAGKGDSLYRRDGYRDGTVVGTESGTVVGADTYTNYKSFDECWDKIRNKFISVEPGRLINIRMEEERVASSEYNQIQANRTKAATEAWKKKYGNGYRDVERDGMRDGYRDGTVDAHRDGQENDTVTVANTNTNSNTNTNKILLREREETGGQAFVKTDFRDHDSPGPREFSIHRPSGVPILIHLPKVGVTFGNAVAAYLKGYSDRLLMHHKMTGISDEFIAYILVEYFSYMQNSAPDANNGHFDRAFQNWCTKNFNTMERNYSMSLLTPDKFDAEVEKLNGHVKDPKSLKKFISFYKTDTGVGKMRFQLISGFNVKDYWERWLSKEIKGSLVKTDVAELKYTLAPSEENGWTKEEMDDWYKEEIVPKRFKP